MVEGVIWVDGVGEGHVEFEEEVGHSAKGGFGDVVRCLDEGDAVGV